MSVNCVEEVLEHQEQDLLCIRQTYWWNRTFKNKLPLLL
jgi:hypothetical protein